MIGLDGTGPAKRHDEDRRVMQVTAEYQPVVTVGGLGEAVRGLVRSLEHRGRPIDVVVPDYAGVPLDQEVTWRLPVPSWPARYGLVGDGSQPVTRSR